MLGQVIIIIGLQQHITELGVGNAAFAILQARADGIFLDHPIDGKMFSDIAQKIEKFEFGSPCCVINESCLIFARSKIKKLLKLNSDLCQVVFEDFFSQQVTLV